MIKDDISRKLKSNPQLLVVATLAVMVIFLAVAVPLSLNGSKSSASTYLLAQGQPPAKANLITQMAINAENQYRTCQQNPTCGNTALTLPPSTPGADLPFSTGIKADKYSPMSSIEFTSSNHWETIFQGTKYSVYCGSTPSGVPAVDVWKNVISGASITPTSVGFFKLPNTGSGVLTATSFNGSVLTMSTPNGSSATFNLATLTLS